MGSKLISVKDEAYRILINRKTPDKSFSDVIIEMNGKKGSLDRFIGIWSKSKGEKVKEEVKVFRKKFDLDIRKRERVLFRH